MDFPRGFALVVGVFQDKFALPSREYCVEVLDSRKDEEWAKEILHRYGSAHVDRVRKTVKEGRAVVTLISVGGFHLDLFTVDRDTASITPFFDIEK